MQRPGGSIDGKDLAAKGLKGAGFGEAQKLTEIDKKYQSLNNEGKLKSTPFSLPWTNQDTAKLTPAASIKVGNKVAAKPTASATNKKAAPAPAESKPEEKKKGFFGLF